MKQYSRLSYFFASMAILLLLLLSAVAIFFVVPAIASLLSAQYSEYREAQILIQGLLTVPAVLTFAFLIQVQVLLRLVQKNKILSSKSQRSVTFLAVTGFGISVSIVAIYVWLICMNTLPPLVAIVLVAATLLALAVSFAILVLKELLEKATLAAEDLEGVI